MTDSFSHDSEASWCLIPTTADVLNPSVAKVIPQNILNFIDFEVNLPIVPIKGIPYGFENPSRDPSVFCCNFTQKWILMLYGGTN